MRVAPDPEWRFPAEGVLELALEAADARAARDSGRLLLEVAGGRFGTHDGSLCRRSSWRREPRPGRTTGPTSLRVPVLRAAEKDLGLGSGHRTLGYHRRAMSSLKSFEATMAGPAC